MTFRLEEDESLYAQTADIETTRTASRDRWYEIPAMQQQVQELAAHSPLFFQGSDADYIYEILEGVVCCSRVLADGRRQVLSFSFPGDLIGLAQGDHHRYNTETLSAARIRRIPKGVLLKTATDRPELGRRLLDFATTELAAMQDHFVSLGRKTAVEKVASFLVALGRRHVDEQGIPATFDLPMTRADIGDYLGLTIETVSRCLKKLRVLGAIDLPRAQTVVISDFDLLCGVAECEDD